MASKIELCLYGSFGTHALLAITLSENRVVVIVAPWEHQSERTVAVFESAELLSIWSQSDSTPEELVMPWDIIAFDSEELADGRWKFGICCSVTEFIWRSDWPIVYRP